MALYALLLKHAADAGSVQPRLPNDDDRKGRPYPPDRRRPELRKPRQQAGDIAGAGLAFKHLLTPTRRERGDQPDRSTEFERNEYRSKAGADGRRLFRDGVGEGNWGFSKVNDTANPSLRAGCG